MSKKQILKNICYGCGKSSKDPLIQAEFQHCTKKNYAGNIKWTLDGECDICLDPWIVPTPYYIGFPVPKLGIEDSVEKAFERCYDGQLNCLCKIGFSPHYQHDPCRWAMNRDRWCMCTAEFRHCIVAKVPKYLNDCKICNPLTLNKNKHAMQKLHAKFLAALKKMGIKDLATAQKLFN